MLKKIYSKTNCPKCDQLKDNLNSTELLEKIEIINHNDLVKLQNIRNKITDGMGFPVAEFEDGTVIGGDVEKILAKIFS